MMENKVIQPIQPIPEAILLLALLKDSAMLIQDTSRKIERYEKETKALMSKLSAEQKNWVEGEWKPWAEKNLKKT